MENKLLKPYEELVIRWKSNDFFRARIKLTFLYQAIILAIIIIFSVIIIQEISGKVNNFRERNTIDHPNLYDAYDSQSEIDEFFDSFATDTGEFLIFLNISILFFSTFFSYFLAGKTLTPIRQKIEEQDQFIADISHELRNPLWAIQVSCESLLREKTLTLEESKEAFKDIHSESERLIHLSEWLLTLIKNINQSSEDTQEIRIFPLIEKTLQILSHEIQEKKIHIDFDMPQQFFLIGSEEAYIRVFFNLIQNAVKFSNIWWNIEIFTEKENSIYIKDYGDGIELSEQENIFKRFYKVEKARSFETRGSGLGLSIVREILLKYGYDIRVESTMGVGSTFIIHSSIF
jgi:signal transduction histidine kinase